MIIYYSIDISSNIDSNVDDFINSVQSIIEHRYGWSSIYPITFKRISSYELRQRVTDSPFDHFELILMDDKDIHQNCGSSLDGLSCFNYKTRILSIRKSRWLYGSKQSKMSLKQYRNYLINHEVGHAIGLPHNSTPIIKDGKCYSPIMHQQTKGQLLGCLPTEYPMKEEVPSYDKLLSMQENLIYGGGMHSCIVV